MSIDCFCDYDMPSVSSRSNPRARKRHSCSECGSPILPGEQYEYVFGVWDGDASIFKTCERCTDLRQWVQNNVPCLCWAHGSLLDDLEEAIVAAQYRAPLETVGLRFGFLRRRETLRKVRRERKEAEGASP